MPPTLNLRTVGDAVEFCRNLITDQLNKAAAEKATAHVLINGDKECRRAFLTLLPNTWQRLLFMETMNNMRAWPRCSCIFGAPPYYFLRPGDGAALSAIGLAQGHRRINMTYDDTTIPSHSTFGVQYTDEHDRDYRIGMLQHLSETTPLVGAGFFDAFASSNTLLFNIKIRKKSARERARLMKTIEKERIIMPRGGQRLKLTMTNVMRALLGTPNERETTLNIKIESITGRAGGGNTASLTAKIVG
jgi:hypothetical protein